MLNDMINTGKKSLSQLLREKALDEVREQLEDRGIDIDQVDPVDIEEMVAQKVLQYNSTIKGVAVGGALAILVESLFGF